MEPIPLKFGDGDLKVGRHGAEGGFGATIPAESTLTEGFHRVTTACTDDMETDSVTKTCVGDVIDSPPDVDVSVDADKGSKRASVNMSVSTGNDRTLVPTFECVKPFRFPGGVCTETKVSLKKLEGKIVRLPFDCFASQLTPPPSTNYTRFAATASGVGSIILTRTKNG